MLIAFCTEQETQASGVKNSAPRCIQSFSVQEMHAHVYAASKEEGCQAPGFRPVKDLIFLALSAYTSSPQHPFGKQSYLVCVVPAALPVVELAAPQ